MNFFFLTRVLADGSNASPQKNTAVRSTERTTKLKSKRDFARMSCGEFGPTLRHSLSRDALWHHFFVRASIRAKFDSQRALG